LFVPGVRPERFAKAAASGTDMVCLDLEDAVAVEQKAVARSHVLDYLQRASTACELVVRVNSTRSRVGLEDLLALASAPALPQLLALPKVESAAEIEIVRSVFAERGAPPDIIALVETLRGIELIREIARAPGVAMIGLGTADLAAEMGVSMAWAPMQLPRSQLVQAAKAARVKALDGAWLQLDDAAGLAAETRQAAALGFSAKVCLHPRQIDTVHDSLRPADTEIELARDIVDAFEASPHGAAQFRGRMLDLPVVEAARRMLADWGAPG
jgi:citrate lyase beta subunit